MITSDLPALVQAQKYVRREADPDSVVLQDTDTQVPPRSATRVAPGRDHTRSLARGF